MGLEARLTTKEFHEKFHRERRPSDLKHLVDLSTSGWMITWQLLLLTTAGNDGLTRTLHEWSEPIIVNRAHISIPIYLTAGQTLIPGRIELLIPRTDDEDDRSMKSFPLPRAWMTMKLNFSPPMKKSISLGKNSCLVSEFTLLLLGEVWATWLVMIEIIPWLPFARLQPDSASGPIATLLSVTVNVFTSESNYFADDFLLTLFKLSKEANDQMVQISWSALHETQCWWPTKHRILRPLSQKKNCKINAEFCKFIVSSTNLQLEV